MSIPSRFEATTLATIEATKRMTNRLKAIAALAGSIDDGQARDLAYQFAQEHIEDMGRLIDVAKAVPAPEADDAQLHMFPAKEAPP